MDIPTLPHILIFVVFVLGYIGIILEFVVKINKSAIALFIAVVCWLIYFIGERNSLAMNLKFLSAHLGEISEIIFFLLAAMTLVEIIDAHKGFNTFTACLHTRNKRKMLWIMPGLTFFLSAILDNLTTTILMISILRKLVPHKKERFLVACMVVVAANAGGAWTPIGDVTTTMLWINGQISTLKVITALFLPCVVSIVIPLLFFTWKIKGEYSASEVNFRDEPLEPGAHIIFISGICCFLFVPVFKALTGMPPYMGMLISLAALWLITDLLHHKYDQRKHLRVPFILSKVDVSSILFFLGILLAVDAIEATGILKTAAMALDNVVTNQAVIATLIGIISAIIDNVPLVAATMGMYDLQTYPMDSSFWLMITYAAGTGGSILVMGSAAGVALMGIEKVDFTAYFKTVSLAVFVGYIFGMLCYIYVC